MFRDRTELYEETLQRRPGITGRLPRRRANPADLDELVPETRAAAARSAAPDRATAEAPFAAAPPHREEGDRSAAQRSDAVVDLIVASGVHSTATSDDSSPACRRGPCSSRSTSMMTSTLAPPSRFTAAKRSLDVDATVGRAGRVCPDSRSADDHGAVRHCLDVARKPLISARSERSSHATLGPRAMSTVVRRHLSADRECNRSILFRFTREMSPRRKISDDRLPRVRTVRDETCASGRTSGRNDPRTCAAVGVDGPVNDEVSVDDWNDR